MRRAAFKWGLVGLALVATACSGDGADETSSTGAVTTSQAVTSLAPAGSSVTTSSTETPVTSVTTSAAPGVPATFPDYTILSRDEGEDGDTIVVLLDTESYESLTDIDLANVLADVVERFPPVLTAYVIDNEAASAAVLTLTPTVEQQELLDRHYLVRLEEGFRMVFAGPFKDTPIAILGS